MPTLETIGHALFGSAWRVPMANALHVNERTVRRWHAGEHPVPDGVWIELRDLLAKHGHACLKLYTKLGGQ